VLIRNNDDNGNRTSAGYTTGDNNQLTSDGTCTYTYDAEGNRTAKIAPDESVLHMDGHIWRKINFAYTVTSDTIIEFDFRCAQEGRIHGIGLIAPGEWAGNKTMKVHGTRNWGDMTYDDYEGPGWKHYRIPVGEHYTGDMARLFFGNDDDVANAAESWFRNVRVYEDGQPPGEPIDFGDYTLLDFFKPSGPGAEATVEDHETRYVWDH
jgi:YD repeat-containing protein